MKKTIHTEITINAPIETVWAILTDFPAYPQWNSFVIEISGKLVAGEHLHVCVQPKEGRTMRFKPRIIVYQAPQELRWLGSLPLRGLFDGEHFFQLDALSEGVTRLAHGEHFSGIFVGLMAKSLERQTLPAFEQMNRELKQRAESHFRHCEVTKKEP